MKKKKKKKQKLTTQTALLKQLLTTNMKTKKKKTKLELYYHESQKNGKYIKGADLEKHLIETGLIDQCLSFEDEVVKGWIDKPETYPEEYKKVYPHLWKSTKTSGGYRLVAYLD